MNVVNIIGRLVADPELRYTPSGVAVTTIRVAVQRRFKDEEGNRQCDFFDCVAWRATAEYANNYLGKGRLVGITGELRQRTWVQQDGQKRSKVEIVIDHIQSLEKARAEDAALEGTPEPAVEA